MKTIGPFLVAYQNLPGRCLVCKDGSHVTNIPKADWSSVKNKQLTNSHVLSGSGRPRITGLMLSLIQFITYCSVVVKQLSSALDNLSVS